MSLDRSERRRRERNDEAMVAQGMNPEIPGVEQAAALTRLLYIRLEKAKRDKNVDSAVDFLYSKSTATLHNLRDVPVACRKGCSHCCNIWVSVSAPEVFYLLRRLPQTSVKMYTKSISDAHLATKDFPFDVRDQHPYPCPFLISDLCSVYQDRPLVCRFAASADAQICARSYMNVTDENIPTPMIYVMGRGGYSIAFSMAMKKSGLAYHCYEFNAALARAMEFRNAEQAWLNGEDVFLGVARDPEDPFSDPNTHSLYQHVFRDY